jgi:putative peptide maturation system protein
MEQLVQQQLVAMAVDEDPPLVMDSEIQAAADEFRVRWGLCEADATYEWLKEFGLTVDRFGELLTSTIQVRKFRERVVDGRIHAYFRDHRSNYDTVRVFEVVTQDWNVASQLANEARRSGLWAACLAVCPRCEGRLVTRHANSLPPELFTATVESVVGPVHGEKGYWVAEILSRATAQLDDQTRCAIREELFGAWVAERKRHARVAWHWL